MDKKILGAILPGNSTVELKEFEIPKPGHGQVLVKTKASTICGSDIRCIYRKDFLILCQARLLHLQT